MANEYKEVDFHEHCPNCKHFDEDYWMDPCHECLNNPTNLHSRKPVNFEPKEDKK